MPGSPPIRIAEPGTRPPPQTRSNSAMPVTERMTSVDGPDSSTNSILRPPLADWPFGASASAVSSTMVFQAPQDSQRPAHLAVLAPQDWQT